MYINRDLIEKDSIERRDYQLNIARSASKENTLVVLPTGLGKTIICLLMMADRLKSSDDKILFLAPTKPLVNQHADFIRKFLTIDKDEVVVFTGEVSPGKRKKIWNEARVIVSTPQVIENDLLSKRMDLSDVCFLIFDEAHHAVGGYAYVFVSEMYTQQREGKSLILGMTASPGNDLSKILEVCKNLSIKNIEIRTKYDPDVKPYVHDLKISWNEVKLPQGFVYSVQLLKKALSKRLKALKKIDVIESSSVSNINRTKLLEAQRTIQKEIKSRSKPPKALFKAASIQSEAMKIHYALELLQTQGVNAFKNYLQRMGKEASSKSGSKASRSIMSDLDIMEAAAYVKSLDIEHPKVEKIEEIVKGQLNVKPSSRIIVFTHYRDTSSFISKKLENVKKAKPVRFIGQSGRENDKGLTQKEQAEVVKKFREGEYNVLIATSVAEEGLDIPSTDMVVFYEPIPSEIRFIQRRGRTARKMPGKVIILITKGTSDEGYYWSAKRKEKNMRSELELLRSKLDKKIEDAGSIYEKQQKRDNNADQRTLSDFSKKKGTEKVKIVVDHREYRSDVVKNLAVKGIFVEPSQLDVGDYVVSSRIGVERKSVEDFLDSLISGKLFKQVASLKNAYSRPVLILEGKNLFGTRNINHNAIFGSLASISVDFGIPVMQTKDALETADLLYVISRREQREEKKQVRIRGDKTMMSLRERQQFLVEGLPNVSAVIAKRLLSHFGSIRAVLNASEEELQEVKGVGRSIASDIVKVSNAEYGE